MGSAISGGNVSFFCFVVEKYHNLGEKNENKKKKIVTLRDFFLYFEIKN
jgi:hypothetical protein